MITQTARKILSFALTITMLASMVGCSSQAVERPERTHRQPVQETPVRVMTLGEKAAAVALQQVGVPYRYGGASASGFDCSGLVQYSYGRAGKSLPRTTGQLWSDTSAVNRRDLRVGDLLFFNIEGKMSHVGLYVGGQQFVHAPSSGRTVSVATLDAPFYAAALIRGGRPR
jgi:cell wall-associated NlpC family hydrolase